MTAPIELVDVAAAPPGAFDPPDPAPLKPGAHVKVKDRATRRSLWLEVQERLPDGRWLGQPEGHGEPLVFGEENILALYSARGRR